MCRFYISEKCHFSKKCFKTSSSAPTGSAVCWRVVCALEGHGFDPWSGPMAFPVIQIPAMCKWRLKQCHMDVFNNSLTIDILDNCGEIFDNLLTGHFFLFSLYFSEVAPPCKKMPSILRCSEHVALLLLPASPTIRQWLMPTGFHHCGDLYTFSSAIWISAAQTSLCVLNMVSFVHALPCEQSLCNLVTADP